jgi:rod shape-determining protein MreD
LRNSFRSVEVAVGPALWPSVGFVVLALLVQTTFAPYLTLRSGMPSFVTAVVVLYALRTGARRGVVLGAIAGALTDMVAGTGGGWTIADTLVALGSGAVSRGFFSDGMFPPVMLVAIAVLARDALFWLVMLAEGYPRGFFGVHLHATLESAALTALATFVYLVIQARLGRERPRIQRYA